MEITKQREIEEFLENVKKLSLIDQTILNNRNIYDMLRFYGIKDNDKENGQAKDVRYFFDKWSKRFQDKMFHKHNFQTYRFPDQKFWGIKSKKETNDDNKWIKIYLAIDSNHLDKSVDKLINFLDKNNDFEYDMKVAGKIRSDNIVIRIKSEEDAKKIIDFISNDNYISEGKNKQNPFMPNTNDIGKIHDAEGSYNDFIANFICEYLKKTTSTSYSSFIEYLKNQVPHFTYLKDMETYFGYKNTYGQNKKEDSKSQENNNSLNNQLLLNKIDALYQASYQTYLKYQREGNGYNQLDSAIKQAILNHDFRFFTNENNVRNNLINTVSANEVKNLILLTLGLDINSDYNINQLVGVYINTVYESIMNKEINNSEGKIR